MYKEFVIIIVVITLIVSLDIITNNYTKDTVMIMSNELETLKKYVLDNNQEEATKQMENIKNIWEDKYKILAFYLEHDELEKVKTQMTELAAFLSVTKYDECVCDIDTSIFILKHIQEKEEFHLRSIF